VLRSALVHEGWTAQAVAQDGVAVAVPVAVGGPAGRLVERRSGDERWV
jgi:hypothetical protein